MHKELKVKVKDYHDLKNKIGNVGAGHVLIVVSSKRGSRAKGLGVHMLWWCLLGPCKK